MPERSFAAWGRELLAGSLSPEEFEEKLTRAWELQSGRVRSEEVCLDLQRAERCGYPEVIYGENKQAETIREIISLQRAKGTNSFVTRLSEEKAHVLLSAFPMGHYNSIARTFRFDDQKDLRSGRGRVVILTAGTSDQPVAEEAKETAIWMGADVTLIQDVGVAGPQRLRARYEDFKDADALIVVAGMEGALPSVVGGYVSAPVIAVPTSIGYGAAFGGLAALLGMLNSCASNVVVVNIDAGFKAGYVASLIAQKTGNCVPAPGVKSAQDSD